MYRRFSDSKPIQTDRCFVPDSRLHPLLPFTLIIPQSFPSLPNLIFLPLTPHKSHLNYPFLQASSPRLSTSSLFHFLLHFSTQKQSINLSCLLTSIEIYCRRKGRKIEIELELGPPFRFFAEHKLAESQGVRRMDTRLSWRSISRSHYSSCSSESLSCACSNSQPNYSFPPMHLSKSSSQGCISLDYYREQHGGNKLSNRCLIGNDNQLHPLPRGTVHICLTHSAYQSV